MSPSIHLEPYLTTDHLEARYRKARDPVEHDRWHVLWLLARGMTTTAAASATGYSAYWIGQTARRYNRDGPEGASRSPGRSAAYARDHARFCAVPVQSPE
jgi:hypothetical protein